MLKNKKVYKCFMLNNFNMFPSDLTGSLDDFFFKEARMENTLVFIDGAHDSKAVTADITNYIRVRRQ